MPRNRFFVWRKPFQAPEPWDPDRPGDLLGNRTGYISKVLQETDRLIRRADLVFFLTANVHTLPEYGPHVVAIILEDQGARIPDYSHKVAAVFKCHGLSQSFNAGLFKYHPYPAALSAAQYLRDTFRRLPGRLRRLVHAHRQAHPLPPLYTIPLGYANQVDLPFINPIDRPVDLFFAGSIAHRTYPLRSPQRWLSTPKQLSRGMMLKSLERLQKHHPDLVLDLEVHPSYASSTWTSPERYSRRMMSARICLVPRGSSLDTFRLFEAARFGCIPVVETLPPHWFYQDAPVIQVNTWEALTALIPALLKDPDRLQAAHQAVLDWWATRCSETAVARFIASRINALHTEPIPSSPSR